MILTFLGMVGCGGAEVKEVGGSSPATLDSKKSFAEKSKALYWSRFKFYKGVC